MKIALINRPIGFFSPFVQRSPVHIWNYEVANRLAKFHDVIVYSKKTSNVKNNQHHQGVHYKNVSDFFNGVSSFLHKLMCVLRPNTYNERRPFFSSKLHSLMYSLGIAWDLRSEKCDIVHIHNYTQFIPIIRFFNPDIKIVLHMHGDWLTQLDRCMIEKRLDRVDLIIGCSDFVTGKIKRNFPKYEKICHTVYNGVDANQFHAYKETMRSANKILFVGRISPEKGLHVLMEAFGKVIDRFPHTCLDVVGLHQQMPMGLLVSLEKELSELSKYYQHDDKLGYFRYLKDRVHSLNLSDKVNFHDPIPHSEIDKYYRDADILVNPSFYETFGMSLIEAMACETPVIASRVGGMTEVCRDQETGILVEPGDEDALADSIAMLISGEELRRSMGKAARERVLRLFTWEKIVNKLLSLICAHDNNNDGTHIERENSYFLRTFDE